MVQKRRRHNHSRRHCSRQSLTATKRRIAAPSLGGSRYLKVCHGLKIGPPPHVDLAHEIKVQNAVRDLIREGLVQSAHDCSEGGLAVALAESCFNPERLFGAEIDCSRRPVGDAHAEETNPPALRTAKRLQYCLTSRNLESSSRSRPETSTTQLRCYASVMFHFSNWAKSAATNCKFGSTNKPFAGELPRFTTNGGTRSVAQLDKTKAFRACESAKGAIESTPI